MSAYIVNHETIKAVAIFAVLHIDLTTLGLELNGGAIDHAQTVADVLNAENYRSINARYRETQEPDEIAILADDFAFHAAQNPDDMYNVVSCYSYQSCEARDWMETTAFAITELIKASFPNEPDCGPWGFPDRPAKHEPQLSLV